MVVFSGLGHALALAFFMLWEVLWPLALGFLISAIIQTVVSRQTIAGALGEDSPRAVALATIFGAASSSCSYAAVAIARSLFRKGATLANAIIFEFASTNLVFELGLALLVLLGWPFLAAEFSGGLLMILILAVVFRLTLRPALTEQARGQAERGIAGRMEGHGAMDMAISDGPFHQRIISARAFTSISHTFYMDIDSVKTDLALGFLIAGALAAWVPDRFWSGLFLNGHPALAAAWGPVIGPIIALVSFVCSVGNVPLAAVLWNGGISFGGVVSFLFADLLIIPILDIYRRYYGGRVAWYLFVVSYLAMAVAGFLISLLFGALDIAPAHHSVAILTAHPTWDINSVLDVVALVILAVLGWRFLTTGGPAMLRMMDGPAAGGHDGRPMMMTATSAGAGHDGAATDHEPASSRHEHPHDHERLEREQNHH